MSELTHLDAAGHASMVDVSDKPDTERRARARAVVRVSAETAAKVRDGNAPKGDVIGVARIAGIQAAKRTSELIPLCHPLSLSYVGVEGAIDVEAGEIELIAEARTTGPTGVEMEALTAASVASGVTSSSVSPVPPVVKMSAAPSAAWRRSQSSIAAWSSDTTSRATTSAPAARACSASAAPERSSVSPAATDVDTVRMAVFIRVGA
jgi:cyclic pyranopterin phosphate synthase